MWGGLPYSRYYFFNILEGAGGGLEHKNSTVMMSSRWTWRQDSTPAEGRRAASTGRIRWLGLVSHEYFHVWNVKRLRPVELGPFDYENEVYTRSLWIAEGLTSYYGPLALRRAGITNREQYLNSLSALIRDLQTTPGRLVQPVEGSSYDAWIKAYRATENSSNTEISYYTKGAVLGFLLDAKIRRSAGGTRSLDDAMRAAYQRFSGERGFAPEEFQKICSETAGTDLSGWFHKALSTTEELEFDDALDWFGLEFRPGRAARQATTGLVTRADAGRLMVTQAPRGTPGYEAGVNVDDEILAVNNLRVRPDQFQQRIRMYQPGETVTLLISRREVLETIPLKLVEEAARRWQLRVNPKATTEQQSHLREFLRE